MTTGSPPSRPTRQRLPTLRQHSVAPSHQVPSQSTWQRGGNAPSSRLARPHPSQPHATPGQGGIKRTYGAPDPASRRPITTSDLLAVLARSHSLHGQDRHMLAAAFTFAFFGLLRISEFTTPSLSRFDPRLHPTLADLSWAPTHCIFHLQQSKTDQFFQGHMMRISRVGGPLCPFAAMARYLADRAPIRTPTRIPLFSFASGRPLTRTSCLAHLRLLLHKAQYPPPQGVQHAQLLYRGSHGRSSSGTSTATIKRLGRWCSSAYRRYIRPHHPALQRATARMARLHSRGLALPATTPTGTQPLHAYPGTITVPHPPCIPTTHAYQFQHVIPSLGHLDQPLFYLPVPASFLF